MLNFKSRLLRSVAILIVFFVTYSTFAVPPANIILQYNFKTQLVTPSFTKKYTAYFLVEYNTETGIYGAGKAVWYNKKSKTYNIDDLNTIFTFNASENIIIAHASDSVLLGTQKNITIKGNDSGPFSVDLKYVAVSLKGNICNYNDMNDCGYTKNASLKLDKKIIKHYLENANYSMDQAITHIRRYMANKGYTEN
jgi:hypothetical protein